jgi:hypothetical protein
LYVALSLSLSLSVYVVVCALYSGALIDQLWQSLAHPVEPITCFIIDIPTRIQRCVVSCLYMQYIIE